MMTVREQALEVLGANSGREIAMYSYALVRSIFQRRR